MVIALFIYISLCMNVCKCVCFTISAKNYFTMIQKQELILEWKNQNTKSRIQKFVVIISSIKYENKSYQGQGQICCPLFS